MADSNDRVSYKDAEAPGGEDLYGAGGSEVTGGVDVAGAEDADSGAVNPDASDESGGSTEAANDTGGAPGSAGARS